MRDMASERRRIFVQELPRTAPSRQRTLNLPGTPLRIAGGGGMASIDRGSRLLCVLNDDLEPSGEFYLSDLPSPQVGAKHEKLIVLSDLAVVLIGLDRAMCIDRSGRKRWSLTYPSWPGGIVGGDAVVINQYVAIAVPERAASPGWAQVPSAHLAVLEIGKGSEIGRVELVDEIGDPQGFHAVTRPGGAGGMLDGGYGQDGSQIWRIAPVDARVEATSLATLDRVLGDLSPSGQEVLTTPHGDDGLILYSWDDLTEVARLERASLFESPERNTDNTVDGFDYYAWFLSNDRLIAMTRQRRLLLIDRRQMEVECQLVPNGFDIIGCDARGQRVDDPGSAIDFEGEISTVTVIDENRILVHGQDQRLELCELSI